jgi:MtN3 and saliva related transmembrane protein
MHVSEVIGWAGFILLVTAWVPQTIDTIKKGKTDINIVFIILYVSSSVLLTIYAIMRVDYIFIALNGILTIGSSINLFYKLKPRDSDE